MNPVSAPTAARTGLGSRESEEWRERAGRLYRDLERPARAMVRRAFRGAFSDHEIEDIYSSAWVGTLRALERRQSDLPDEEIRKYLLTAVANQASKELRRRRRKPTAPLELVGGVADTQSSPEERATDAERSRVTRDLLASLPPRRRAVMLLRYGWGLEPKQVCDLVKGLSPRAYRKEITRGVDDLTECMRKLERGDWCSDREGVLKAYASGLADAEQRRQAKAHMAHCHECSDFVGRLSGHLHDLGSAAAVPAAVDGLDGHVGIGDRLVDLGDRARDAAAAMVSRGGADAPEHAGAVASAGGTRGAGVATAGVVAKIAGFGTAGKIAVACVTGSVAATACIGAGVVPGVQLPDGGASGGAGQAASAEPPVDPPADRPLPDAEPSEPPPGPAESPPSEPPAPAEPSDAEPVDPVASDAPPVAQEFGVAAAAAPAASGSSTSSGGSSGAGATPVQQEFGP